MRGLESICRAAVFLDVPSEDTRSKFELELESSLVAFNDLK